MRALKALIVTAGLLALTACASTPPSLDALAHNDPYEATNRDTLVLNGKIDKYFVVPTVGLYFPGRAAGRPPGGAQFPDQPDPAHHLCE